MAPTGGLEPPPSGFVARCPLQLGDVDEMAPLTGLDPATSRSTGGCSSELSYSSVVRAPGLEPGLVPGKNRVPYQSGVARVVSREGIEPPVSEDDWVTARCAPWRDRLMGGDRM